MLKTKLRGRPRYDDEDSSATISFRRIAAGNLDRGEMAPLWVQLKNRIQTAIENKVIEAQSRIPSEQALCEIFDVSRPVIRAALSALAAEGFVIKIPRKGMFVAGQRREVDFMTSNLGVFGDLTAKGHTVTAKTFEFYRDRPNETEKRVFGIPDEGSVIRITRVYSSDGNPITLTHISLPGHKVPGMEKLDIENRSVFQTIKEQYGLTVKRAERWFTTQMPTEEAMARMGVPSNMPLIAIESIAYDHDGAALEYYNAFYNSAVARIHLKIEA
jgi:GntR family transcriptional regulator